MRNKALENGGVFLCMIFAIFLIGMLAGISFAVTFPEIAGIETVQTQEVAK